MPFIDPVTLQQILDFYTEGMPIQDISTVLMLSEDEINAVLDNLTPYL